MTLTTCTDGKITPATIVEAINDLETIANDTNEPSGFIREDTSTMGIMEFSPDGTTVYQINSTGVFSSSTPATFGDGSALAARKFVLYPVATDFEIYVEGTKSTITTTKTVTLANTSGLQFVYFSDATTLASATTLSTDFFEETPIVSLVYWNATTSDCILWADERHGITMDGITHRYMHFTEGAKYVSGMGINGLTSNGTTHGQLDAGVYWDEDIMGEPSAQTNLPFWYLNGTVWEDTAADGNLGLTQGGDTKVSYNQDLGASYQLTELAQANDCVIIFFALTNNKVNPYVKIIGQNSYASVSVARDAISDEVATLVTEGLPSPEFIICHACIINGSGELQLLADGSTHLDLREVPVSGASGASGVITDHLNLLNIGTNTHAQIDTHITTAVMDGDFTSEGVMYRGATSGAYSMKVIGTDIQAYDADTAKTDVAQSFTASQRATFVTTEDNSIAFNSGNNLSFTATAANITVTNQTAGQSGTLVIASANLITGWGTEFDWGYQGVPTNLTGTEIFGYTISGASGADSIKIGRV